MRTLVSVAKPQPLWFIDALAYVHVGGEETDGRFAIVEGFARAGSMPPLHVHQREDEVFHVLEGRLTLFLPGEEIQLDAGATVRAPQGVPHTYRVESETARWLVFCQPAGFDAFVRAVSTPAASRSCRLPTSSTTWARSRPRRPRRESSCSGPPAPSPRAASTTDHRRERPAPRVGRSPLRAYRPMAAWSRSRLAAGHRVFES